MASALDFLSTLRLTYHAVFERGHIVEKVERLEHHADVRTVCARAALYMVYILAVIEYLAGGGSLKQVYAAKQCRFARAGCADYARDVAGVDREVNVTQDFVAAEAFWKDDLSVK